MNPEIDAEPFTRLLETIGEFYDVTVSPGRSTLFFGALREYDWAIVQEAFSRYLRSDASKFGFPKPQHIREIIEGSEGEQESNAWVTLETAIKRVGVWQSLIVEDPFFAAAITRVWGSWIECCEFRSRADQILWNSKRKDFVAAYRLAKRTLRAAIVPTMLMGYCDQQNASSGFHPHRGLFGAILLDGKVESRYLPINARTGLPAMPLKEALRLPESSSKPALQLTAGDEQETEELAPADAMVKIEEAFRRLLAEKGFPAIAAAPARSEPFDEDARREFLRRQHGASNQSSETLRDSPADKGKRERRSISTDRESGRTAGAGKRVPIRRKAR